MTETLAIKGIGDGLLVNLPDGDWAAAQALLLQTIDRQSEFFRGAKLALRLGARELGASELGKLRDDLAQRQVSLRVVICEAEVTRTAAADLGLSLEVAQRRHDEPPAAFDTELAGEEAVLVSRTLRSGNRIHFPGHVIILGDVNPGSEIIAGGHVLVWGRLRGVVHAGAAGNEQATVCALELAPTQLRIAGHIAVSPERRGRADPEMASVRGGQLVAESWRKSSRR